MVKIEILLIEADNLSDRRVEFPIGLRIMSIVIFLIKGPAVFVLIKRVIKSEIALIIDLIRLYVNPKKSLTQFIKWYEILGLHEIKLTGTRIIFINVKTLTLILKKKRVQ